MKYTYTFLLALVIALTTSCKHHIDWVHSKGVKVKLAIDWSEADIDPYGSTICIYDRSGVLDPMQFSTHYDKDSVYLMPGHYSVIVFNETMSTHEGIRFIGMDRFDTAQAFAEVTTTDSRSDEDVVVSPDMLAIASIADLEVTRDMLRQSQEPVFTLTPKRVSVPLDIKVHIQGLYNVSVKTPSTLTIDGMAAGINLGSGQAINMRVIETCELIDHVYDDGSDVNGVLAAQIYSFGLADKTKQNQVTDAHEIALHIALRSEEWLPFIYRDVTNCLHYTSCKSDTSDPNTLHLELEFGVGADEEDETIIIPYVHNTESGGSGFDAGVSDWGDNTDIPVVVH